MKSILSILLAFTFSTITTLCAQSTFNVYACSDNSTADEGGFLLTKDGRVPFSGEDDHEVKVEMCWADKTLRLPITWRDDTLDTSVIIKDSVRWSHSSGNYRGDRMYFYDNLAIRLFFGDIYYEAWISPEQPPRMQWQNTASVLSIVHSGQPGKFTAIVDLDKIGMAPEKGLQFDLSIVAPDADRPGASLVEKFSYIKYQHFRRTFILN